ncbi:MAG: heme oxygenase (biliverdin-producing) [Acidibrevibacterium sp.]|uniref:biliverdin-producing heme oxygenase n=1 Tax=Acidibrevibacterium sp. TaxID=2606776 RepID=UPI003D034F74
MALRDHTRDLHTEAEYSGIVQAILEGSVGRADYALFLRNLLPAYETMGRELRRHCGAPALRALVRAEIFRTQALTRDLEALAGAAWRRDLPRLPAGREYADRIACAAADDPALLIAHAYVRYLGDLHGGRLLKKRLAGYDWLPTGALAFYEFPAIPDIARFIAAYRAAIDRAADLLPSCTGVIAEAAMAFRLNIAVSNAVLAAVAHVTT